MRKLTLGIWVPVILALVLISCSESAPPSPAAKSSGAGTAPSAEVKGGFDSVIAAAKKEGKVTVYGALDGHDEQLKNWAKLYPEIKLEPLDARSSELIARVQAEQASKNYVADVIFKSESTAWTLKRDQLLAKWDPENELPVFKDQSVKWMLRPSFDKDGFYIIGYSMNVFGIAINTKLVPPDKEPKDWMDLADPQWKGKITMGQPWQPAAEGNWSYALWKEPGYGEAYFDKMAKQDVKFVSGSGVNQLKLLAAGEFPILPVISAGDVLTLPPGTPVKWILAKPGYFVSRKTLSIAKNAPHPNAARVFAEYFMSKDAQRIELTDGRVSPRADVTPPYSPAIDVSGAKFLDFDEAWWWENGQKVLGAQKKRFNP